MSLPKYAEYKDSGVDWLGEIPSHWAKSKIRRLAMLGMGQTILREMLEDGPCEGAFPVYSASEGGEPFGYFKNPSVRLKNGDLIIGARGSIGMTRIVMNDATCTQTTIWAKLAIQEAQPPFIYWTFVGGREGLFPFDKTAIPMLTVEQVASGYLPFPPVSEQTSIAAFLDRETAKIDALIAEQEKLIALLAEKRQATISHAVTRGLNPDAPMKDSGVEWLAQVPAHWQVQRLKVVSQFITSGPRGWSEQIAEFGSLFIQSGDLNDSMGVEFASAKRVPVDGGAEAERTRLQSGDVLVCITGAKTGNVAVCESVPEPAYVNQHLCLIRPSAKVLPTFLGASLKSTLGRTQFELSQYGLKQGLSLENVREVILAIPPIPEQRELIDWVNDVAAQVDSTRMAAEQAVALLKERRAALIAAAVTGQIDVRNAAQQDA
ncbi:MAG: restriction endonuclease subunit S [Burkholderiaceae bacterium]